MSNFTAANFSDIDMALIPRKVATRLNGLGERLNNLLAEIAAAPRPDLAAALARRALAVAAEIEAILKKLAKSAGSTINIFASIVNLYGILAVTAAVSALSAHRVPRTRFARPGKLPARISMEIAYEDRTVRAHRLG